MIADDCLAITSESSAPYGVTIASALHLSLASVAAGLDMSADYPKVGAGSRQYICLSISTEVPTRLSSWCWSVWQLKSQLACP